MGESHKNRGLDFEEIILNKCEQYIKENRAYIVKIPTSFKMVRKFGKVVSAFPEKKSICDFLGVLANGKAIAIETKRISSGKNFPFANIGDHQFVFFDKWRKCGGLHSYYLIWWKETNKCYLVDSDKVEEARNTLDRKSLPITWFEDINNCVEVKDFEFLDYIEKQTNN